MMQLMKHLQPVTTLYATIGGLLVCFLMVSSFLSQAVFADAYAPPRIAVINIANIERKSKVWQDLKTKIDNQNAELKDSIKQPQTALRERQKELAEQKAVLSNEAFRSEQMKLQKDMRDFTNKVNNLKKQVQENFASSRAKIRKKLVEILSILSEENKIDILLNTAGPNNTVVFFATKLSLNQVALERLDAEMQTIEISPFVKD